MNTPGSTLASRTRPTPAELGRSLLTAAPTIRVGVLNLNEEIGRYALTRDGSLLFVAPARSRLRECALAPETESPMITATAVDVAGVPQPDRIRGVLTLVGGLAVAPSTSEALVARLTGPAGDAEPGPVLQLTPSRVGLEWYCEVATPGRPLATRIPVEEYRAARPDPLAPYADEWLAHLHADHDDVLTVLADEALPDLAEDADVRPLLLDRHGLVLRVTDGHARHDVRLAFVQPAGCACEVRSAFNDLVTRLAPAAPGRACDG